MIPILLVDDDPDMLNLMRIKFGDGGNFEVAACLDARDALQKIQQQAFEVIISDFRMPVMNGGEFVKEVRKTGYNGLFIIYSGRGKDPLIEQARHDGADVYIPRSGDFLKEFSAITAIINNRETDMAEE